MKTYVKIPTQLKLRKSARLAAILTAATLMLGACAGINNKAEPDADPISKERIAEIVASPDRSAADRINDVRRRPIEMLDFIGVRKGMVALDLSAGGGYTTELIARAVGPSGRVYGQSAPHDPDHASPKPAAQEGAPAMAPVPAPTPGRRTSPEALAERAHNPAAGNIIATVQKFENPVPAELTPNGLDLVTLMFNYHDLGYLGVDRAQMNKAVFTALKPGAFYIIADHMGRPGTGISESGTLHRIEEAFLVREVEAAGFKLLEEGNFLRNPADPRDKNIPSPPQPKDEFVLKFVKPS